MHALIISKNQLYFQPSINSIYTKFFSTYNKKLTQIKFKKIQKTLILSHIDNGLKKSNSKV